MEYEKQLEELKERKLKNIKQLSDASKDKTRVENKIEELKGKMSLQQQSEMRTSEPEDYKARFGNAEKRKADLDRRINNNDDIKALSNSLLDYSGSVVELDTERNILRNEEKYLFKMIDLYIAKLQFLNKK